MPVREEIIFDANLTKRDYVEIIAYYEYLIQEWEAWGNTIKTLLTDEVN